MQYQPVTPPFPVGTPQLVVGASSGFSTPFSGVFGGGTIMLVPATKTWTVPDNVYLVRCRGWACGDVGGSGFSGVGAGFFMKTQAVQPGQQIVLTVAINPAGATSFGTFASATANIATGGDINSAGAGGGAAGNLFGNGGLASGNGGSGGYGGSGFGGLGGAPTDVLRNGSPGAPAQPVANMNIDLLGCGAGGGGGVVGGGIPANGGNGINGGGGGLGAGAGGNGGQGGYPGGGGGGAASAGGTPGQGAKGLIVVEY